jgi:endonuclease G
MHTPSLLLTALTLIACTQQSPREMAAAGVPAAPPATAVVYETPAAPTASFLEDFESGSKGAYAPADEALATGSWRFEEALIGSADQDHKAGAHAARLRGLGRLTMLFNAPAGIRTIRLQAAAYGQDGPSTWELWLSRDGGRTWQRNGQPIITRGPKLVTSTFAGTATEPIRLQIRKVSGNDNRLNIDNISLETGAVVATTPTPNTQTPTPKPQTPNTKPDNDNLLLGNPSGATANPASLTNYLLTRPQFAIGYNAQRGTPTWTCWHLGRADISGAAPRQDDFRADPALPRTFNPVTPKSYAGSGFDKGHNCPSADRSATLDDNSATFLMSNMVPQAPHNNQQTWNHLEAWTRDQIQAGQEAYVLMGCYGRGGTGAKGLTQTLDQGRVTVPARLWKVVVLLPEGPNDLQRLAAGQGRVVAVDTPNDNAIDPAWEKYRTSVDKIEAATGLDLLSALPAAAQARLQK